MVLDLNRRLSYLVHSKGVAFFSGVVLALTAIANFALSGQNYRTEVTLLVLGVGGLVVVYVRYAVSDMEITYIQVHPSLEQPSVDHHKNRFRAEDGLIRFDVYVEVPKWMDSFSLNCDADPPFDVGIWDNPNDIPNEGNKLTCDEGAHNFQFRLHLGDDLENLRTGDRNLSITETKYGACNQTIQLVTEARNTERSDG